MPTEPVTDVYSPREVALAAGVPEEQVLAYLYGGQVSAQYGGRALSSGRQEARRRYLTHAEAVRVGAALATRSAVGQTALFRVYAGAAQDLRSRPVFALSSTVHATLVAMIAFVAAFDLAPRAATLTHDAAPRSDLMRLVFLATPGPGGGGGGGGLRESTPPPKAMREGHQRTSSPVPAVKPIAPAIAPTPPIASEPLPTLIAPIVSSPSNRQNRAGVLEQTTAQSDAHGPGTGGGAGTGTGTGLGSGSGPGVGPGSGGGTGGGPYRPGSGIDPPRLLKEVKADYTEDARRRGLSGEVVLEIVVRSDGTVGDVKTLQGLDSGLNERAVEAVRQWRFAPAQKQGTPVDVLVEVAVEFKLR